MAASGNTIEVILALTIEQFQKGVKRAESVARTMAGNISTAMGGVDQGFKKAISASQAYHKTLSELNGTADHFKNTMLQMAGVLGGGMVFTAAARAATSFNSTIEQSQIGIAALVRTFTGVDMGQSFVQATEIQKRLQIAGLETTATYQELLVALQEGVGPALREGFNPAQIVKFTQSMTQAAAGISLPMHQLGQELRAILDGTIDKNARIATTLQIKNEDIKAWKDAGTLFQELENRLKAFSAAGEQSAKTFSGAWSNVLDALQMGLGTASTKSFGKVTEFLLKLKDAIVTVDAAAGTFTFNEKIMAALAGVDERISKLLASFSADQITAFAVNLTETLGAVAQAVIQFVGVLAKIGEALGPMGPVIAGTVASVILFGGALKAVIGLPLLLYRQLMGLLAGFKELGGFQGVAFLATYVKDVQLATKNTGLLQTATFTLGKAMTVLGGVVAAAFIGWEAGKVLGQVDLVQQMMLGLIYSLDRVQLAAQKMWASLTGGDVAAIEQKIAIARQAYDEESEAIRQGKGAGEKKQDAQVSAPSQPAASEQPKKPLSAGDEALQRNTTAADARDAKWRADENNRYLDSIDASALTPEQLEDRKKRWAERESQEKQLTDEKNDLLDKVAEEKKAEDERREKIRQADAKRAANPDSIYAKPAERKGTGGGGGKRSPAADSDIEEASVPDKQAATPKKKKVRSSSSDQILTTRELEAQKKTAAAIEAITSEAADKQAKTLEEQTAAAKEAADKQAAAQKEGVGKMQSVFTAYAERVKQLQNEIAGREKSLADELADRDPHASEELKWRRKAKAAQDYEKAAKAALQAGRLDEALSLSDQAKQAYSGLNQAPTGIKKDQAARTSYAGLKSSGELGIAINKLLTGQAFATAKADLGGVSGLDGLGSRIMADLSGKMAGVNSRQGVAEKGPDKVYEIRLGKAKLQGSPDDVEEFLKQIKRAGLSAA